MQTDSNCSGGIQSLAVHQVFDSNTPRDIMTLYDALGGLKLHAASSPAAAEIPHHDE